MYIKEKENEKKKNLTYLRSYLKSSNSKKKTKIKRKF